MATSHHHSPEIPLPTEEGGSSKYRSNIQKDNSDEEDEERFAHRRCMDLQHVAVGDEQDGDHKPGGQRGGHPPDEDSQQTGVHPEQQRIDEACAAQWVETEQTEERQNR